MQYCNAGSKLLTSMKTVKFVQASGAENFDFDELFLIISMTITEFMKVKFSATRKLVRPENVLDTQYE